MENKFILLHCSGTNTPIYINVNTIESIQRFQRMEKISTMIICIGAPPEEYYVVNETPEEIIGMLL